MPQIKSFSQVTVEVLDYDFDFTAWLAGDTIDSATATATPAGLTVANTFTSRAVKVWCSGGVAEQTYDVACVIVTTAGRTKERCFELTVTEDCDPQQF